MYDVLAVDPSGNFSHGKGGTGIATITEKDGKIIHQSLTINARGFNWKGDYYSSIINNILNRCSPNTLVVIEDFRLQSGKAKFQTNQKIETSELIGSIEISLAKQKIKHIRQQNTIKSRWPKKLLLKELYELTGEMHKWDSPHALDASRHALHAYFNKQKGWKE